jgi:hypothetical protein
MVGTNRQRFVLIHHLLVHDLTILPGVRVHMSSFYLYYKAKDRIAGDTEVENESLLEEHPENDPLENDPTHFSLYRMY